MDIKELRSKMYDFFRSKKLPVPSHWNDEQVMLFQKHIMESRTRITWHTTRDAHVRVSGASTQQPAPATPSVSDAERAECRRRAQAILDEHDAEQREIQRRRIALY